MKRTLSMRRPTTWRRSARFGTVLFGLWMASASAATNFLYDAYVAPNTLPSASGFSIILGAGGDSETVSGSLLTIVDTGTGDGAGYVWNLRSLTSAQISSNSTWEARARMRLAAYNSSAGFPGFTLEIEDGAHVAYAGMRLSGSTPQFYIMDAANQPAATPFTPVPNGDDFYNLLFRKVGTSGTAADTLELYVNGTLAMTNSYANTFAGVSLGRNVFFGNPFGGPSATTQMTGASFGIDQAAPALVPEPSSIGLGLLGMILCWRSHRRRASERRGHQRQPRMAAPRRNRNMNSESTFLVFSFVLIALTASAPAATYLYLPERGFPTNQNWTRTDGGPFPGGNTETVSNANWLVVTDNNSTFAAFTYRQNAPTLNSEVNWQMRARLRLQPDYTGTVPIYSQFIHDANADNQGGYSFGLVYTNGQTWVSLRGVNDLTPIGVAGTPMLDIVATKTTGGNPLGRGDDPIVLEVYQGGTLVGTVSTSLGTGSNFNPDPAFVEFGNVFGAPTGTFVLEWASFGIGEAAPTVPEPSSIGLGLLGLILCWRRCCRRG